MEITQLNPDFNAGPWTAYTPVLSGTGWAIGDGTITGGYVIIGKTVHFRIRITFAAASTFGAAASPIVSLPAAARGGFSSPWNISGRFSDVSPGALYLLGWQPVTGTTIQLNALGASSVQSLATSTVPFTWASGDEIFVSGTYEAA